MDRKCTKALVLAALCWAAVGLQSLPPLIARAEALFRFIPIATGDPDDVYWSPPPPGHTAGTSAGAPAGTEPREFVHRQGREPLAWLGRLLSLILFRP
jgi:hypothetical protein